MPSIDFWLDFFRRWFGRRSRRFEAVGPEGPKRWRRTCAVRTRHNVSGDATLVLPQDYVDVVITPN